jgi:transglutaminase-like putative cysteine protease
LGTYLEITDKGPLITQWLNDIDRSNGDIMSFLIMVNRKIHEHIAYTTRLEPGVQTSEESLRVSLGSCRDSAWLLVQVLRHLNLAARFVSGYLIQLSTPESEPDHKEDVVSLHAWAEAYIPGAGWIGLDPTGGLLTAESHIPLACTPSPESAAPINGTSEMGNTVFSYTSSIMRF